MLLEGVIVLEEFCKELAAIVFVKSASRAPPGRASRTLLHPAESSGSRWLPCLFPEAFGS